MLPFEYRSEIGPASWLNTWKHWLTSEWWAWNHLRYAPLWAQDWPSKLGRRHHHLIIISSFCVPTFFSSCHPHSLIHNIHEIVVLVAPAWDPYIKYIYIYVYIYIYNLLYIYIYIYIYIYQRMMVTPRGQTSRLTEQSDISSCWTGIYVRHTHASKYLHQTSTCLLIMFIFTHIYLPTYLPTYLSIYLLEND